MLKDRKTNKKMSGVAPGSGSIESKESLLNIHGDKEIPSRIFSRMVVHKA